ncbi:MAG: His/Gly/Thr/Pro-type tRNA ligase C-terminal domain-containing protein, partial [Gemmatimonadales bacterium]
SYRIRGGELMKVPYLAVIGQREADAGTVAVRTRGAGNKQEIMPVAEFSARVAGEIRTRARLP